METKISQKKVFQITAYSLFIVLWLYASLTKLINYRATYLIMMRQPLPIGLRPLLAWFIPSVELTIVVMLLFPYTQKMGLWISLLFLSMFTGYIVYAMILPAKTIPCSCGGIIGSIGWRAHLYFNVFWMLLAIGGIAPTLNIRMFKTRSPDTHQVM